jgi:S-DNA-T family DNA segregation ATPase FtsK/SpoIIIE
MGRSSKKGKVDQGDNPVIRDETKHGVIAVACFAAALFFILASLPHNSTEVGYAGRAGQLIYGSLSTLFGAGYFVLPLVLVFLGISFFQSIRPNFVLYRFLAGLLFFVAFLGMIQGGLVGHGIAVPLDQIFGAYGLVLLGALMIISLLVIFDVKPQLSWFATLAFWRKREETALDTPADREIETIEPKIAATEMKAPEKTAEKERPKKLSAEDEEMGRMANAMRVSSTGDFKPPPLSLLETDSGKPAAGDIKANANIIKRTLANFGIVVEMDEVSIGPSITRYAFKPAEGVKLSKIVGLQNDLSLALAAHPLRIEAPIPGKSLVGIEIPNSQKAVVGLASLLGSAEYASSPAPLLLSLGRGITGGSHFANLAKAPHMLVAGTTGSGKSVVIHTFIASLLYRNSPERLRFIMIDPKRVELTLYNKIPHLLTPVITEAKKAILALKWAIKEMERRYALLETCAVRDLASYHKSFGNDPKAEKLPYIVVIIDELADIMTAYPRELEGAIVRLAQMSRAIGIHLVLSTQRPSVDVITGLIKANIPTRLALQVSSQIDSRTILDMPGAEKLLGAGDMLYLAGDMGKPIRLQSAYVSESEAKSVAGWLAKNNEGAPTEEIALTPGHEPGTIFSANLDDAADDEENDELYEEAREEVIRAGKASASYLQRKLKVGYARAARLLDLLEERGVIGPGDGAKQREVYEQAGTETNDDQATV